MTTLNDILYRIAANTGLGNDQLHSYADALCAIVEEARERDEDVELMTFGTLVADHGMRHFHFRPHPSLFAPVKGDGT